MSSCDFRFRSGFAEIILAILPQIGYGKRRFRHFYMEA